MNGRGAEGAVHRTIGGGARSRFGGPKSLWGWIGVVPLLTGLIGSCPLYSVFGFSTCPLKKT